MNKDTIGITRTQAEHIYDRGQRAESELNLSPKERVVRRNEAIREGINSSLQNINVEEKRRHLVGSLE